MGQCCDDVSVDKTGQAEEQPHQLFNNRKPAPVLIPLHIDIKNEQCRSYRIVDGNQFIKSVYNWHAIPISNAFNLSQQNSFRVTSLGIKDSNFVIGAIKKSAMVGVTKMPWKTSNVICYESHSKKGEPGVIYNKDIKKGGRGLQQNETMTVTIIKDRIVFQIGNEKVASRQIPSDFINDQICPYVALFTDGDRVRLEGEVIKENR